MKQRPPERADDHSGSKSSRMFWENPYDIAGLIDIGGLKRRAIDQAFRKLRQCLRRQLAPNENEYGEILLALVSLAQKDYGNNARGFYLLLERHFQNLENGFASLVPPIAEDPSLQSRMCDLYHAALKHFGYPVPQFTEGVAYSRLNLLLFHAGLPGDGARKAARVALRCVRAYQADAELLGAQEREDILQSEGLNTNDLRLFSTPVFGSDELWKFLCHAAAVWDEAPLDEKGEAEAEIRESCPPSILPERIMAGFQELAREPRHDRQTIPYPSLRYDFDTGAVLLQVPFEPTWQLTGNPFHHGGCIRTVGPSNCELWQLILPPRDVISLTAEVFKELRERRFELRPSESGPGHELPGLWFSATGGRWLRPEQLRYGVPPGTFHVLLPEVQSVREGTPLPLFWEHLCSEHTWTAWEIDVPEDRSSHFALTMDGRTVRILRANRGGRRLEIIHTPVTVAELPANDRIPVYASPPEVRTATGELMRIAFAPVRLFQHRQDRLRRAVGTLDGEREHLPADRGGVFQVRRVEGIGQLLERFAVIPGLTFQQTNSTNGPLLQVEVTQGCLSRAADAQSAASLSFSPDPVQPYAGVLWKSADESTQVRVLLPVSGIRWRLIAAEKTQAKDWPNDWRDETLVFTRREAAVLEPIVELEVPPGSRLLVEGSEKPPAVRSRPTGDRYRFSLVRWDQLIVRVNGGNPILVALKSDRPRLTDVEVAHESDDIVIRWKGHLPDGSQWLFWNPLRPDESVRRFDCAASQEEPGEFRVHRHDIGIHGVVAVALGRTAKLSLADRLGRGASGAPIEFGTRLTTPDRIWFGFCQAGECDRRRVGPNEMRALVHATASMLANESPWKDSQPEPDWKTVPDEIRKDLFLASLDPPDDSPAGRSDWGRKWLADFLAPEAGFTASTRLLSDCLQRGMTLPQLCRQPIDLLRVDWSDWLFNVPASSKGLPLQLLLDLWSLSTDESEALRWSEAPGRPEIPNWLAHQAEALERVVEFVYATGMDFLLRHSPAMRLPWHQGTLPSPQFRPAEIENVRWDQSLGLEDWTVELIQSHGDSPQSKTSPAAAPWKRRERRYTAQWDALRLCWRISRPLENLYERKAFYCSRPDLSRYFEEMLGFLHGWEPVSTEQGGLADEWGRLRRRYDALAILAQNETLLPLHQEILAPNCETEIEIMGCGPIRLLDRPPVSDTFRLLWFIAWATVYRQRDALSRDLDNESFCRLAAGCCEESPEALEHLLVMAELAWLQWFGRGLGNAVRNP